MENNQVVKYIVSKTSQTDSLLSEFINKLDIMASKLRELETNIHLMNHKLNCIKNKY